LGLKFTDGRSGWLGCEPPFFGFGGTSQLCLGFGGVLGNRSFGGCPVPV
jgi:hypothetical protein